MLILKFLSLDRARCDASGSFFERPDWGVSRLSEYASHQHTPFQVAVWHANDWRVWFGMAQLLVCLPLHVMLGKDVPRILSPQSVPEHSHRLREVLRHPAFWKLATVFAANMFIFSALSVHLIPLLKDFGHTAGLAVLMATLIGPMQVAGRICERTFARNVNILITAATHSHKSPPPALTDRRHPFSRGAATDSHGMPPFALVQRRRSGL